MNMWKFKPFMHKEQAGLEGRSIDVGNIKVHVKHVIAEGGFSSVYSARDLVNPSKQYALKHMICNDGESLDLVMKEISVLKSLKGHPNVVTLEAHTIFDMGRTKEAMLLMEFCDKSLVNVLESRGAGYYDEKQVLTIFRDVCNAVFAMHCQSPPIAHRDLKAENLLLGSDWLWKLCDFGSTSTNHKSFEKPEEMGLEEDNIRKHTTPAYRAPEMWDLFRRDVISEKVDIWVWFRVNELLPSASQKSLPDRPPAMRQTDGQLFEEISKPVSKASSMPRRSPPPPPSVAETRSSTTAHASGSDAPLGAFWSTQHTSDSVVKNEKTALKSKDEKTNNSNSKTNLSHREKHYSPVQAKQSVEARTNQQASHVGVFVQSSGQDDDNLGHGNERLKEAKSESTISVQNDAFRAFVADFDISKLSPSVPSNNSGTGNLEAELRRLREQLRQANLEKAEISSKYEKLSAICRSQRQEIQELKQALAARSPSPSNDARNHESSPGNKSSSTSQKELGKGSPSVDSKPWQAFADEPNPQTTVKITAPQSVRTRTRNQNNPTAAAKSGGDGWGFDTDSFSAFPTSDSVLSKSTGDGNGSRRFRDTPGIDGKTASQPAGWAGF
ncbi:putative serine/threonine-protein kinase [Drosera capensis]